MACTTPQLEDPSSTESRFGTKKFTRFVTMEAVAGVSGRDIAVCVLVGLFTWLALVAYRRLWAEPRSILRDLQRQGVSGPPFRLIFGQLPEMRKVRPSSS